MESRSGLVAIFLGSMRSASSVFSTTSVAVVYAVMLEFGFNMTDYGKTVLAACFVTDLGTVIALGLIFAPFTIKTLIFLGAGHRPIRRDGGDLRKRERPRIGRPLGLEYVRKRGRHRAIGAAQRIRDRVRSDRRIVRSDRARIAGWCRAMRTLVRRHARSYSRSTRDGRDYRDDEW